MNLSGLTNEQLIDRLCSNVMSRAFSGSMRQYRDTVEEGDAIKKELLTRMERRV